MAVLIPTVWCPYCDSANELNSKSCWRCRQRIPLEAERTGVEPAGAPCLMPEAPANGMSGTPALPAPVAAISLAVMAGPRAAVLPATPDGLVPWSVPAVAVEVERKQCAYCREWIDPQASVCPYCRTDQGAVAAVQRATWAFMQLFFCFAALGVGIVVLVRLWQWGMAGGLTAGLTPPAAPPALRAAAPPRAAAISLTVARLRADSGE